MFRGSYCFFFFLSATSFFSQSDSVFLMNGIMVASTIVDTSNNSVTIKNPLKENKTISYESDQLYMIKYASGQQRYYYSQDSISNWLTREEMWMYMKGERDAHKGFKARGAFIGAAIAGIAGGMTGSFWGPVAPYGYMALSGLPKVKIRHNTVSDLSNLKSESYIMGYERVARQRLKTRSLLGGTIGLVLGYGIYAVFNDHYPEKLNFGFNRKN